MTPLDLAKLREIARSAGPCVTIFLPTYRPGEQTLHSTARLLRNFVQEVSRTLCVKPEGELLKPLNAMAEDPRTDEGSHWPRVLLRSPQIFETAFLREPAIAKSFAGERFELLPLLRELNVPREFYILRISRKHAGFFRVQFAVESLPMPGSLPDNLTDFLAIDRPDHDLENRSLAGPLSGRRVRFGTGVELDIETELGAYYTAVDRAVQEFHPKGPLLLAGVEQETARYRAVSSHPELVEGSLPDVAPDQKMVERAFEILRNVAVGRALKELVAAKERLAPARFSTDLKSIAAFAAEGRVARLFVRAGEDNGDVNVAAVETIKDRGDAVVLPTEKMSGPVAAALRY